MDFSRDWFFCLDARLRDAGLDSDAQSFDEILENLRARKIYDADAFAGHCAYVILAGGFSQKTAKKIHEKIMNVLDSAGADFDALIKIFNNKNKINAICKIWENREQLRGEYYKLELLDDKLNFLQKLPHVGKITANHLARNLGEDVVKYDIWIQRLGCAFVGKNLLIDNAKLSPDVKCACDDMFAHLVAQTGLPRGYIDVVLWKSCQVKLISMDDCLHKPLVM
ncbi:MAG: hypothetical protein E7008_03660 [Alphaproteobacteria bacterium]|nr:hypothetical protein [Alphaproteobacteria bacterium]